MSTIKPVDSRPNFPKIEEDVSTFWKENKIFQKSIDQRSEENQYKFVDGPPFVTGMPHYGSLLPSIAKDVIPRYWTMKGKRVRRVWGWDCHGIPIEEKVTTKLGLKGRDDIEKKIGVEKYIEECRKYVESCSSDWRWYIDKIGRWVDMDNAYYTMNVEYMESVIWAFKQIYEKGLIYKGKRTSMYSTDSMTPVSNFEVAMDTGNYKDVEDLSVFVKFKLKSLPDNLKEYSKRDVSLIAWTTTPWTMPSNFALAVNSEADYCLVEFNGEQLIVAKDRLEETFEVKKNEIGKENDKVVKILSTIKGTDLEGLEYYPIYDYFVKETNENDFKVYLSEEVVLTEGTGVLHLAPAFGEADFEMGKKFGLSMHPDIDEEGKMTIGEFKGIYLRDASPLIAEELEKLGKLFRSQIYTHRLPFYRGENPLIYVTQDSYFINVQKIKARMLELNKDINWIPDHIKTGRFAKTVETSPDWCISRNRYWATIMPIWKNDDGEEIVIGSIEEMMQYSDQITKSEGKYFFEGKPFDLHRNICDKIVLKKDGKEYYRIPEVLDCWVESGSVPFAEYHYPFENKEVFEKSTSADYIVEYLGQVRAWFNVLLRMSTILFDESCYKNVICTGVMSGNDGRKMSKSYGNYPDPREVLENIGGEALRLYMMSSPIMIGEDMNWNDEVLKDQIKNVLLPIWNTYKYLSIYANLHNWSPKNLDFDSDNILDLWIYNYMNKVTLEYSKRIEAYNIPSSVRLIQESIDNISSWYIRRSRDRFADNNEQALQTLFVVLVQFIKTFAPQLPFLTEEIYRNLVTNSKLKETHESIHLDFYPEIKLPVDEDLLSQMEEVRTICSLGQSIRVLNGLKVRQPLSIAYTCIKDEQLRTVIKEELNLKEVAFSEEPVEGKNTITQKDQNNEKIFISINIELSDELLQEGLLKDISRSIQNLRKNKNMKMEDKISIEYFTTSELLRNTIDKNKEKLLKTVNGIKIDFKNLETGDKIKLEKQEIVFNFIN